MIGQYFEMGHDHFQLTTHKLPLVSFDTNSITN